MENVAILFGKRALHANNLKHASSVMMSAMRTTGATVTPHALPNTVNTALDNIAHSDSPALVFAVANGRDDNTQKPLQLYGGENDLKQMMERLAAESRYRRTPLDVFVLTAGNPEFVHEHIHNLPTDSVAIAVRTNANSADNANFWDMLGSPGLHFEVPLSARNLLLYTLMGAQETNGLPEIAVSGFQRHIIADMWNEMVKQGGMSPEAKAELKLIASHMDVNNRKAFAVTQEIMGKPPIDEVFPLNSQFYACAVATMWSNFYGKRTYTKPQALPVNKTSQSVAAPTTAMEETVDVAGAPARSRPRLSNSQVGRLWQPGKKPWQQDVRVVKRLLGRG